MPEAQDSQLCRKCEGKRPRIRHLHQRNRAAEPQRPQGACGERPSEYQGQRPEDAEKGGIADYISFAAIAEHILPPETLISWWGARSEVPALVEGKITNDECGRYVRAGATFIDASDYVWKHPKGIKQGQQIRLANQGQQGVQGGKNGDLYVEINYKETDKIHVDGANVHYTINVAPWEIALGQSIEIDSPAGKVNVTLPKTAKNGQQLRLVDKGIPSKTPGHLYLKLNIVIPAANTEAEQQAYQQLAESFNHFNPRKS